MIFPVSFLALPVAVIARTTSTTPQRRIVFVATGTIHPIVRCFIRKHRIFLDRRALDPRTFRPTNHTKWAPDVPVLNVCWSKCS